jgi:hypothetical protein
MNTLYLSSSSDEDYNDCNNARREAEREGEDVVRGHYVVVTILN